MKIKSIILSMTLMLALTSVWGQGKMQGVQQDQTQDVSDKELHSFADAYQEIQSQNQEMQQKAVKTIEDEGMEIQRFNEIASGENNPEAKTDASAKEKKQMEQIKTKLQEMQADFQKKIAGMIEKKGLTVQRYQEINQAVQQDKGLQEKLQGMMKG